jgi:hypothetical protein
MTSDIVFRAALAPVAALIWARYLSWPVVSLVTILLIINKFRPVASLKPYLPFGWWAIVVIGASLVVSLVLAFVTMPENDLGLRTVMYFSFVLSLPTLIPCFVALFFKPHIH